MPSQAKSTRWPARPQTKTAAKPSARPATRSASKSATHAAPRANARRGEVPVLLVHGILGQRHLYWNLLANRLKRRGHRVHEVTLPYGLLGDLRLAAGVLRERVDALRKADGAKQVDIVAHSAGGLVARYYLGRLGGEAAVRRLVCLGTCHKGTYFAYVLGLPFLDVAGQTRPDSEFIREVNAAPPGKKGPARRTQIVNLWSPVDGIVLPSQNAMLPGARNVKVDWMHHWGFLLSPRVHDLVANALSQK